MDPKPVGIPSGFKIGGQKGTGAQTPAPVPAHDYNVETMAQDVATMVGQAPAPAPAKVKKPKAQKPAPAPVAPIPVPVPVQTVGVAVPILGKAGTKIQIVLPPALAQKIQKPVTGMGGWQRVLIELQAGISLGQVVDEHGTPIPVLTLTPFLLDRLIVLAVKHGSGGYQAVIRWIVCLALDQNKSVLMGGKGVGQ